MQTKVYLELILMATGAAQPRKIGAAVAERHGGAKLPANRGAKIQVPNFNYRRIRLTQVTTTYRIRGYGKLPHEFNGF